jgi:hypothetical protein
MRVASGLAYPFTIDIIRWFHYKGHRSSEGG